MTIIEKIVKIFKTYHCHFCDRECSKDKDEYNCVNSASQKIIQEIQKHDFAVIKKMAWEHEFDYYADYIVRLDDIKEYMEGK